RHVNRRILRSSGACSQAPPATCSSQRPVPALLLLRDNHKVARNLMFKGGASKQASKQSKRFGVSGQSSAKHRDKARFVSHAPALRVKSCRQWRQVLQRLVSGIHSNGGGGGIGWHDQG
ncbi:hypothetical protein GW17_00013039, partial [Ensete ventricosum]